MIDRLIKSLSYPGSIVLDFFAGSGTVGRVCIAQGRHCLMCDSDPASKDYFNKHIELMKNLGQDAEYEEIQRVDDITVHKNLQKTTIY
ncbi:DNA methyltransferase [Youxingia wuxianensis]|uniref:Site-specific DNA-methyltransferase n=1 Tax=Youxingia wuxianensis TaxID=2763678 RepID=A0A926EP95_9FIRM|nr:DNA methyltransferase [Youxingia wuxianensis]MBC8585261.1 site-specific DNA-methyltransferase [Youxingia wuxianensis]